jgi:antitoxin (DNA-binding transcriptional repressor) of toxin-antitoxin stability system
MYAFALVVAFPYVPGSESPAFKGVSLFLGLLLFLASSSAISNIVAGVILTYTGAFRLGDRVQIADTTGTVVAKTLLVTRVQTIKNVDISIPNALVLSSHIVNFSHSARTPGLILHTSVTIMKTLTITDAKKNLSRWLDAAARGQDIGIICGANIIALRKVEVESTDYAQREYGATQDLHTSMTERGAEHLVAGQEDSLEIAGNDGASRRVVQEACVSGVIASAADGHSYFLPSSSFAAAATRSGSKPNFF